LAYGAGVLPDLQKSNNKLAAAQGSGLGKCYPMMATINLLKEGKIDRNGNNQQTHFGPVVKCIA